MCAGTPDNNCYIGATGAAAFGEALLRCLKLNFVLRGMPGAPPTSPLLRELAAHYRVPRIRLITRARAMCQAGRARAAGARGNAIAWLCERAPLWVVVHVCALLRDARRAEAEAEDGVARSFLEV